VSFLLPAPSVDVGRVCRLTRSLWGRRFPGAAVPCSLRWPVGWWY